MKKLLLYLLCLCGVPTMYASQNLSLEVTQLLQAGKTAQAQALLQTYIHKHKKDLEGYALLDQCYRYNDSLHARAVLWEQALRIKGFAEPTTATVQLAQAYFDQGRYAAADSLLSQLPSNAGIRRLRRNCHTADSLRSHPADLSIHDMGDSLNTPYDNLWPFISNDGKQFYTTVVVGKQQVQTGTEPIQEDIYLSINQHGKWMPARALQGRMRSPENEGACFITADGHYLFYVVCNQDSRGGCRLRYCRRETGGWGIPQAVEGGLLSFRWLSNPCLTADGKELYFTGIYRQDRNKDLWCCPVTRLPDGKLRFGDPQRLGKHINTPGDEISPYLHPYGQILYFSSNGHPGMGGFDVFYCRRDSLSGAWGEVHNIGWPLNTHRDEIGFAVNVTGDKGYLSCQGYGKFSANKRIAEVRLPSSLHIDAPFEQAGEHFVLEQIFFDTDQARLQENSYPILEKLYQFMEVHPEISLRITGHTDDTGSNSHNLRLSEQRAAAVAAYLQGLGIAASRLHSEGKGSSQPAASNATATGRAQNRRIEVEVIGEK